MLEITRKDIEKLDLNKINLTNDIVLDLKEVFEVFNKYNFKTLSKKINVEHYDTNGIVKEEFATLVPKNSFYIYWANKLKESFENPQFLDENYEPLIKISLTKENDKIFVKDGIESLAFFFKNNARVIVDEQSENILNDFKIKPKEFNEKIISNSDFDNDDVLEIKEENFILQKEESEIELIENLLNTIVSTNITKSTINDISLLDYFKEDPSKLGLLFTNNKEINDSYFNYVLIKIMNLADKEVLTKENSNISKVNMLDFTKLVMKYILDLKESPEEKQKYLEKTMEQLIHAGIIPNLIFNSEVKPNDTTKKYFTNKDNMYIHSKYNSIIENKVSELWDFFKANLDFNSIKIPTIGVTNKHKSINVYDIYYLTLEKIFGEKSFSKEFNKISKNNKEMLVFKMMSKDNLGDKLLNEYKELFVGFILEGITSIEKMNPTKRLLLASYLNHTGISNEIFGFNITRKINIKNFGNNNINLEYRYSYEENKRILFWLKDVDFSQESIDKNLKELEFLNIPSHFDLGINYIEKIITECYVKEMVFSKEQALEILKIQNIPKLKTYILLNSFYTNNITTEEFIDIYRKKSSEIHKGIFFHKIENLDKKIFFKLVDLEVFQKEFIKYSESGYGYKKINMDNVKKEDIIRLINFGIKDGASMKTMNRFAWNVLLEGFQNKTIEASELDDFTRSKLKEIVELKMEYFPKNILTTLFSIFEDVEDRMYMLDHIFENQNYKARELPKTVLNEILKDPELKQSFGNLILQSNSKGNFSDSLKNASTEWILFIKEKMLEHSLIHTEKTLDLIDNKNVVEIMHKLKIFDNIVKNQEVFKEGNFVNNLLTFTNKIDDKVKFKMVVIEKLADLIKNIDLQRGDNEATIKAAQYFENPLKSIIISKNKDEKKTLSDIIREYKLKKSINEQNKKSDGELKLEKVSRRKI